jgi:hypothetical protein
VRVLACVAALLALGGCSLYLDDDAPADDTPGDDVPGDDEPPSELTPPPCNVASVAEPDPVAYISLGGEGGGNGISRRASDDDYYVAGRHDGDMVLLRFGPDGCAKWQRRFHGSGNDELMAVGARTATLGEDALVAGYFDSPDLVIGGEHVERVGTIDGVVLRVGEDGSIGWVLPIHSTDLVWPMDLAVVDGRDAIVVGYFAGTMTIGSWEITSQGDYDLFVARVNGDSADVVWARGIGGSGLDFGGFVAASPSGGVVIAVTAASAVIDVGTGPLTGVEGSWGDLVLFGLDGDGAATWARRVPTRYALMLSNLTLDERGRPYVIGSFMGDDQDFGGGPVEPTTNWVGFVVAYDEVGAFRWQMFSRSAQHCLSGAVAATSDAVYVTGEILYGRLDDTPIAEGQHEMFARIDQSDTAPPSVSWLIGGEGPANNMRTEMVYDGVRPILVAGRAVGPFYFVDTPGETTAEADLYTMSVVP